MSILSIANLNKTYKGGFQALTDINLDVQHGEIFALLGPNGAGKTTLISIICGIVNATTGSVWVEGLDIKKYYRKARTMIGLVPQELTTDAFETVWDTVTFSRGLFGLPSKPSYIEEILKKLSLWDKRKNKVMTLSGGMKRRLMIAKALSHEPRVLFLDEPTAGVDVELRKDMWQQMNALRSMGVTIILTTHYIEEAEEMADRVGVINGGKLLVVEDKVSLMKRMGNKRLIVDLIQPLDSIPQSLNSFKLDLNEKRDQITYSYDATKGESGISNLMKVMSESKIGYKDLTTHSSSLEDIFVSLVKKQ